MKYKGFTLEPTPGHLGWFVRFYREGDEHARATFSYRAMSEAVTAAKKSINAILKREAGGQRLSA